MRKVEKNLVTASTHGRYIISWPEGEGPYPLLVGFHGYAQSAEDILKPLLAIDTAGEWVVASVQGLHWFYDRRNERVVANWMTHHAREAAIEDNVQYVSSVVRALIGDPRIRRPLLYCGFSQGVAMAYRAAARSVVPADGLIVLGGDVPPEIDPATLPPILLGRGWTDDWYTEEKLAADRVRLSGAGARVEEVLFDGGHEWGGEFIAAAGKLLRRLGQQC